MVYACAVLRAQPGTPYRPSVEHLSIELQGIQAYIKATRLESNHEFDASFTDVLSYVTIIDSQYATNIFDTLRFNAKTIVETKDERVTTTAQIDFTIDTVKQILPYLFYTLDVYSEVLPWTYYNDRKNIGIAFKDVPYTFHDDTLSFGIDSSKLLASITKFYDVYQAQTRFSGTSGDYRGSPPLSLKTPAFLRGAMVGLKRYLSSFNPKQYSTTFQPDFVNHEYNDTVALNYYNYAPDTVHILSLKFVDELDSLTSVSYLDSSPIATPQLVLPFDKNRKFLLRLKSHEGPYTKTRFSRFIITQEIGGQTYADTCTLRMNFIGIDYTSLVHFTPNSYLEFLGKPGDTIVRNLVIGYDEPIYDLLFDTIGPGGGAFQRTNVTDQAGRKVVEFTYVATAPGEAVYLYHFKYATISFTGDSSINDYPSHISLSAVVYPQGLVEEPIADNQVVFSYDARSRSLVLRHPIESELTISMYDITGKLVRSDTLTMGGKELHLRTALLPGLYFIRAVSRGKLWFCKLFVD